MKGDYNDYVNAHEAVDNNNGGFAADYCSSTFTAAVISDERNGQHYNSAGLGKFAGVDSDGRPGNMAFA
jgi:hypothetical protein